MGGWVTLENSPRRISDVADLPAADFRIVVLNMVATNMHPPHMEAFGKLTALRELYLPGPMWNPRAESRTPYSENLAYLNGLITLKKLEMSYTFLEGMSVLDVGFEKMQGLGPTLEELVLRRARLKGTGLKAFTNLRALDLTMAQVTDDGMQSLAGMTKLRKLYAGELRITDKGVRPLADLQELEELRLGGTGVTDAGLASLAGLTKLKKLDLLALDITDAGLDHLARMKDLEILNLYRTKVSNAGLEKLKRFTNLKEVDLRYSRATSAGVAGLRAALPNATLIFLDSSAKPVSKNGAAPAVMGKNDKAVADWVQSIGGKAVMENGSLVKVSLNGSAVNDDQLKAFVGRRALRSLVLDNTEIGDLGVQVMQIDESPAPPPAPKSKDIEEAEEHRPPDRTIK